MGRNTRLAISLAASRGVHTPNDTHRQNHVRVLASLAEVAQYVVGDAPDEGDDLVVGRLVHAQANWNRRVVSKSSNFEADVPRGVFGPSSSCYQNRRTPKRGVDRKVKRYTVVFLRLCVDVMPGPLGDDG